MSRDSGKDCKGVAAQKDKRERNLWLRCSTCKKFCILFVQKLGASGVAVGEVCSFDGVELWEWGVQQYFGLSTSVELQISKPETTLEAKTAQNSVQLQVTRHAVSRRHRRTGLGFRRNDVTDLDGAIYVLGDCTHFCCHVYWIFFSFFDNTYINILQYWFSGNGQLTSQ